MKTKVQPQRARAKQKRLYSDDRRKRICCQADGIFLGGGVWRRHARLGAGSYYGVRKYIYESPVLEDKEKMISAALDMFLAGYKRVFGSAVGRKRGPVKAVG
jgi:hypothetical protein